MSLSTYVFDFNSQCWDFEHEIYICSVLSHKATVKSKRENNTKSKMFYHYDYCADVNKY